MENPVTHPPSAASDRVTEAFRAQMLVAGYCAYFDHAAVAPVSQPALEAMQAWGTQSATLGDSIWPEWNQRNEAIRDSFAKLINASPGEIAFVPNTTAGINIVAEGFPWQAGDNVVTLENEFPSNLYPWMNLAARGVETRRVAAPAGVLDLGRLEDAIDDRTRIVSLSWVGYASGWRIPVKEVVELVHRKGALFFLDAIQGLGVFPLNVADAKVDFLAADGHKWLLGPEGAGVCFIRREHLDRLRPTTVGWNSVVGRYAFDKTDLQLRDTAARFEGGSANMVGIHGLGASLDMLMELGSGPDQSSVADAIVRYTQRACQRLVQAGADLITNREPGHESGIIVFQWHGMPPDQVRGHCFDAKVVVSARGGGLRISPHGYNNESDLDQLIAALETAKQKMGA